MQTLKSTMAEEVAQAAVAFERQRTGHAPESVTVVLSDATVVITLHGALTPVEMALAKKPAGAAQVQEFHRQLFASASEPLRREITRITGVEVRDAVAEVETTTGTVVGVFTTGTMVQVFLLAHALPPGAWSGSDAADPGPDRPSLVEPTRVAGAGASDGAIRLL
jgi:uncharacterized protein YbcI